MLEKDLDQKQESNEQQKPDQDLVVSFINLAVKHNILAIGIDHRDDESNKKASGEKQLSLAEHSGLICLQK